MSKPKHSKKISRRGFIGGTSAALVAATAPLVPAQSTRSSTSDVPRSTIRLTINGKPQSIEVEDRWTLVEVLRDHLSLTGTKIGCDRGECGACTVLLEGKPVYSCSHLAVWMDGKSIQTVEGLETQRQSSTRCSKSFMEHDAPQCGFCTSGQLMSAKACLNSNPHPTARRSARGHDRQHLPLLELQPLCRSDVAAAGTSTRDPKIVMVDACRRERHSSL